MSARGVTIGAAVLAGFALASGGHGKHHGLGATLDSITSVPVTAGASTDSANERLGMRMAKAAGWDHAERDCLDWLWTRESGWNAYAANPQSDARGIPQDISGWTDFAPGDARAQIRWGLAYLAGRYGSPCAAWGHETADGWY